MLIMMYSEEAPISKVYIRFRVLRVILLGDGNVKTVRTLDGSISDFFAMSVDSELELRS